MFDFHLKEDGGLWKSQVMNSTEVLLTFGPIDRNSKQVVPI